VCVCVCVCEREREKVDVRGWVWERRSERGEREKEMVIYLAHKVTYLQELTRSYFTWNGLAVRPATFLWPKGEAHKDKDFLPNMEKEDPFAIMSILQTHTHTHTQTLSLSFSLSLSLSHTHTHTHTHTHP
jgi:hypothetical protein